MSETTVNEKIEFGKKESRFYLFIRWKTGTRKFGPPTSTYNGSKYAADLKEELIKLINLYLKSRYNAQVALIYDNTIPKHDPERDILKLSAGRIEVNRLQCYRAILADYQLPEELK